MDPMTPAEKMDQVAGTKPKKPLSKKARLAIIISAIVVALGAIAAVLILVVFRHEEPVVVLTDRDILTAHAWEKQDAPTVIWTLRADGSGELTTNKENYYDIVWSLNQDTDPATLDIQTDWLYKLNDSFTFTLNREEESFSVKNLSDETESTFVPLGTAEKAAEKAAESAEATGESGASGAPTAN